MDNPYSYMAQADVFALTSICEGSPVALIEALATGTAVVSTDCPSGPHETLAGGRYGGLVPVGDHTALTVALASALDHPPTIEIAKVIAPFEVSTSARRYAQALSLG